MIRITEVVKNLIFINIIVFLGLMLAGNMGYAIEEYFKLYTMDTGRFEPVQVVLSMFTHFDISHIFFNMLVLFFLGPTVESALGPKRFMILYLVAGLVGGLAQLFLSHNAVIYGASGATMGVTLAFAMMFPNMRLMLLFPPIPVKAKYIALFIIAADIFGVSSGQSTGIGHYAHLAGALAGALLVIFWGKSKLR